MPALPWPLGSSSSSETKHSPTTQSVSDLTRDVPVPVLAASLVLAGGVVVFGGTRLHKRYWRRLVNGEWVTPDVIARKKWIRGYVTSVGDADNFRFYHTPGFGWNWPLKFRSIPSGTKALKDKTLHIRIAGVDAPEAAHFGRPAQPYSEEALVWLKSRIENRFVFCQLVKRDQYSRIVAQVRIPTLLSYLPFVRPKSLALEMLRAGWVTTYEQSGAEYDTSVGGKDTYVKLENEAKKARVGMWEKGTSAETPAEYKKRYSSGSPGPLVAEKETASEVLKRPWYRRIFG